MSASATGPAQAAILVNLAAIFVSLELSRSTWLVTSLSPGRGERMSKHSVRSGDMAGLLGLLARLRDKARARTGQTFPVVVIQEAGLDGFWIHRVVEQEGGVVQQGAGALVEPFPAGAAAEPAVALGGALRLLRRRGRAADHTVHPRPPSEPGAGAYRAALAVQLARGLTEPAEFGAPT